MVRAQRGGNGRRKALQESTARRVRKRKDAQRRAGCREAGWGNKMLVDRVQEGRMQGDWVQEDKVQGGRLQVDKVLVDRVQGGRVVRQGAGRQSAGRQGAGRQGAKVVLMDRVLLDSARGCSWRGNYYQCHLY